MNLDFMKQGVPEDFASPVELPEDPDQAQRWQAANRQWWEHHPMKYDETESTPLTSAEGTPAFYREIDARFFRRAEQAIGWQALPFDTLIDFRALASQRVLEIGIGCGSHAELLSSRARAYVGVDLTDYATKMTRQRFRVLNRPAPICRMDAERLALPDDSFDFVWSWGVIHHSSNTRRILEEAHRVLRPGGRMTAMVYHWSPWNTFVRGALYYGVLRGGFLRTRSVHRLLQETTDGAMARYYTRAEWSAMVEDLFVIESTRVVGHKDQMLPLPAGRLKDRVSSMIPDALGRKVTNRPFVGFMLVSTLRKVDSRA
jgi:SAM-dependent methyltransferase